MYHQHRGMLPQHAMQNPRLTELLEQIKTEFEAQGQRGANTMDHDQFCEWPNYPSSSEHLRATHEAQLSRGYAAYQQRLRRAVSPTLPTSTEHMFSDEIQCFHGFAQLLPNRP